MITNTVDILQMAQDKNEEAIETLITKFNLLLKKYSRKLSYDDAYNDLRYEFICTIFKIDISKLTELTEAQLINYFNKIIYHHFLRLSKKLKLTRSINVFSDFSEDTQTIIENELAEIESRKYYELEFALSFLNIKERNIIDLIYFNDYSIQEIALLLGTSRQAVNQKKNQILKKLLKIIIEI